MVDYSIYIFHIVFVAPLLILIGLYHDSPKFPKIIWHLLVIMGLGIMIYHGYLAWKLYKLASTLGK